MKRGQYEDLAQSNRNARVTISGPVQCGHRVVHGREYPRAAVVDHAIRQLIMDGAAMAPLHNPANLLGIDAASKVYPGIPQVSPGHQCIIH